MDFHQVDQRFDSKVGECHNAIVPDAVASDLSVLLVHFVGNVVSAVSLTQDECSEAAG
jgi:hypothetical protein